MKVITRRRLSASEDGFTLVEMLVALVVISIAMFALAGTFITAAASIQKQQYRAKAIRVALDTNERLRLTSYDSADLSLGSHSGSASAPDGTSFTYTYVVSERNAGTGGAGDVIKNITTTVQWTGSRAGSVTYETAVAQDAKDIGLPAGYAQTIRSMSVTPAPSTVVDFNGYTSADIIITLILTGHTTNDVVHITWQDDRGNSTPAATAISTNGYQWIVNLGHGGTGIHLKVPAGTDPSTGKGYFKNLTFTAKTDTGLQTTSTLPVYGPTENAPTITSFAVTGSSGSNDLQVVKAGNNQFLNKNDVTATCAVTGLTSSSDSVVLTYYNALGQVSQVPMSPTASPVSTTGSTWTYRFPRTTTYFYYVQTSPRKPTVSTWGCTVTRATDGGPAATTVSVSVHE